MALNQILQVIKYQHASGRWEGELAFLECVGDIIDYNGNKEVTVYRGMRTRMQLNTALHYLGRKGRLSQP